MFIVADLVSLNNRSTTTEPPPYNGHQPKPLSNVKQSVDISFTEA